MPAPHDTVLGNVLIGETEITRNTETMQLRAIGVIIGFAATCSAVEPPRDGGVDFTFRPRIEFQTNLYSAPRLSVSVQPDGKILVAGEVLSVNGKAGKVARLNRDGSLDESFKPPAGVLAVWSIGMQADGKVYAEGHFTNEVDQHYFARFNADGSYDGLPGLFTSYVVQPDGKILATGNFPKGWRGVPSYYFARFQPDGGTDFSFDPGVPQSAALSSMGGPMVLQPDGKILVGGYLSVGHMVGLKRFRPNGSLETSFAPQVGRVWDYALLGDGRILAARERGFDYVIHNIITHGDVSAEPFVVLTNTAGYGTSFAVAADQKMVVIKGRDPNILRFRRDGALDHSFAAGKGGDWLTNRFVPHHWSGLAIESDGSILLFGPFRSFDGINQTGLVRLRGSLDFICWAAAEPQGMVINVAGPRNQQFILQRRLGMDGSWAELLEGATDGTGRFVHRVPLDGRMSWFRVKAVE